MLIDILPEIFKNLSMKDRLRCRQVCRAWSYVVERDFLKELCVYVRGTYAPDVWILDNEFIDPKSVLTVKHLSVLANLGFLQTFRGLKRLLIKFKDRNSYEWCFLDNLVEQAYLNMLNCFHQLENLELHYVFVNEDFELKLNGLKKFIYFGYPYASKKPFPPNLETLGLPAFANSLKNVSKKTMLDMDRLKVLILSSYFAWILQLTALERLHLGALDSDDAKPKNFLARFPRLLLLDICWIYRKRHFNEILQELTTLESTRSIKFYHQGFEVSNEQFKNREEVLSSKKKSLCCLDLIKLLSIASKNREMMLPFLYLQTNTFYKNECKVSLANSLPFEALRSFSNIRTIYISKFTCYLEIQNLLMNLKQLLGLSICVHDFDEHFFENLPRILEDLVKLSIFNDEFVIKSLRFLVGFGQLLKFHARFEENPNNQQIVQSIEERRNKIKDCPLLVNSVHSL